MEKEIKTLSDALGLDPELVASLVGRRIRGSASVSASGAFDFRPQGAGKELLSELKKTRRGGKLQKTLRGKNRLKLSVWSKVD